MVRPTSVEPAHATTNPPASLGEFRVHAVLGQGGSGIVYDASWGPRRVALKVLHTALVGTGKDRAQFLGEAQRLQQIGHPSVVKVLAVGELPDGRPFLAMERLEGETLATLIARGRLALDRALHLFGELCSAVTALHEQGLVHRDLKPENVFVVADRHAVLLDFGIAKDLAAPASTTTQEGNVRGTPAYMAPERFFGQSAGLATDVYELALVLYAMLAGQLPWHDAGDPEARLSPLPLTELAPVPEALDVEIRRALSTRAQNRPASASALYAAVVAAAGGELAEPGAAETARMRPDGSLLEQPTPLAWAPTQAAPTTAIAKKRWPWLAGGLAVIAAAGTFAYVRFAPGHEAAAIVTKPLVLAPKPIVADPNDPWAAHAEPPPKQLPLVAAAESPAKSRAAAANAIAHLPKDTNVVVSVLVDDLRANTATAGMLTKLATDPKVKLVTSDLPECVMALAGGADWIVFGTPKLDTKGTGEIVIGGRWQKSDVVACLDKGVVAHRTKDGATIYQLADVGWLDFVDDHTAYVAVRPEMTPDAVHAFVAHPTTAADPATRALLAKLPADRTLAFVVGGKAKVDWSSMLLLPTGSDVFGWARLTDKGMELDAGADTHDAKAANAAAAVIRPQIGDMFTSNEGVGKLVVALDGTEVHVKGSLTTFTLTMLSSSLDH
jgi:eukaryotic-like serine/threonine-protein kinase